MYSPTNHHAGWLSKALPPELDANKILFDPNNFLFDANKFFFDSNNCLNKGAKKA